MTRADKINEIMRSNNICGEVWDESATVVAVELSWGDWKHDHARLVYLVSEDKSKELSGLKGITGEVTESDGSDCYSAIHRFYF